MIYLDATAMLYEGLTLYALVAFAFVVALLFLPTNRRDR